MRKNSLYNKQGFYLLNQPTLERFSVDLSERNVMENMRRRHRLAIRENNIIKPDKVYSPNYFYLNIWRKSWVFRK
jgi:hypothetical protein